MKIYDPIDKVFAAKITGKIPLTERHGGGWGIALDDGTQVYEGYADFLHAHVGDMYVRPVQSAFNPLPRAYYLSSVSFPGMFHPALPPLKENRVPEERIEAMLESLTVQCNRFPGTTTTIALASLPCGFVVAQGMSACVDPKNFDAQLGVQYATQDAMRKARERLWELEGYFLMRMREQRRQP